MKKGPIKRRNNKKARKAGNRNNNNNNNIGKVEIVHAQEYEEQDEVVGEETATDLGASSENVPPGEIESFDWNAEQTCGSCFICNKTESMANLYKIVKGDGRVLLSKNRVAILPPIRFTEKFGERFNGKYMCNKCVENVVVQTAITPNSQTLFVSKCGDVTPLNDPKNSSVLSYAEPTFHNNDNEPLDLSMKKRAVQDALNPTFDATEPEVKIEINGNLSPHSIMSNGSEGNNGATSSDDIDNACNFAGFQENDDSTDNADNDDPTDPADNDNSDRFNNDGIPFNCYGRISFNTWASDPFYYNRESSVVEKKDQMQQTICNQRDAAVNVKPSDLYMNMIMQDDNSESSGYIRLCPDLVETDMNVGDGPDVQSILLPIGKTEVVEEAMGNFMEQQQSAVGSTESEESDANSEPCSICSMYNKLLRRFDLRDEYKRGDLIKKLLMTVSLPPYAPYKELLLDEICTGCLDKILMYTVSNGSKSVMCCKMSSGASSSKAAASVNHANRTNNISETVASGEFCDLYVESDASADKRPKRKYQKRRSALNDAEAKAKAKAKAKKKRT